ncbi:MAG: hypothetical protein AB1648_10665 [Pseudomonadota bacterium]
MNVSLFALGAVSCPIAARTIGGLRIRMWREMRAGALAAIDPDVMRFLFGMFMPMAGVWQSGASRAGPPYLAGVPG